MKGNRRLIILSLIISLLLASSNSLLSSQRVPYNSVADAGSANNYRLSSSLQTNSSLIKLGYGPASLIPISEEIPVYTVNDQLWIESNYNSSIRAILKEGSLLLTNSSIQQRTATDIYTFGPALSTSNLNLSISGAPSFSIPLQFVNPSSSPINSLVSNYSVSGGTLVASFASPDFSNKFNMQECLTNSSSAGEPKINLPSSFGTGFLVITGDPGTSNSVLNTQNAIPQTSFSFSFELFADYTYQLPQTSGTGYTSSELEVAASTSVLLGPKESTTFNMTFSDLASFRIGRYVLEAFFNNANSSQVVATQLLIVSPSASSWFWLGSCQQLGQVGPPSFSSKTSLGGPPISWPRYLYLMYQVQPGIEGFTNLSLNLNLSRVSFLVNGKSLALPSDIQVSWDPAHSSAGTKSPDIESGGQVYLITNSSNPTIVAFTLSFGGKIFATEDVTLQSSYVDLQENVSLGELLITATRSGQGVFNATVTILSNTLNTSITEYTDSNGIVDVYVPPGSYTLMVRSGSASITSSKSVPAGVTTRFLAVFPTPPDYTQDLIWIVSIITAIGAVGNFWFWFARRRVRRFLKR